MKRNPSLWLLGAAVALYFGAAYCKALLEACRETYKGWFDGKPLPLLSQYAFDTSSFVAGNGAWIAGALLLLAVFSFWRNRKASFGEGAAPVSLNAVGYYTARGVLLSLVALAILQAHGILIIFLNIDRQIRKEVAKPVPEQGPPLR